MCGRTCRIYLIADCYIETIIITPSWSSFAVMQQQIVVFPRLYHFHHKPNGSPLPFPRDWTIAVLLLVLLL